MNDQYRMTRRDKIIVCIVIAIMWFASSSYQAYLRWDLETARLESKVAYDKSQLEYIQKLSEVLAATNQ